MEKGTKENPYSYDEYLELAKTNEWKGGYVRLDDGIVKWEPAQEKEDAGGTGCGSGTGSGEGSGSGSGSGSNDKPQFMVRGGDIVVNVVNQLYPQVRIAWSDGIAIAPFGCALDGDGSTPGGFYSEPMVEPYWFTESPPAGFMIHSARAEFTNPYDIKGELVCSCGPDKRTAEVTFTIPPIYHEDF